MRGSGPASKTQLTFFCLLRVPIRIWYESAHDMAEIFRVVCKILWKPHVALRGVSFGRLTDLISRTITWRETHLHKVGVPTPSWPAHWDFVAAVTACSSDINYHVSPCGPDGTPHTQ